MSNSGPDLEVGEGLAEQSPQGTTEPAADGWRVQLKQNLRGLSYAEGADRLSAPPPATPRVQRSPAPNAMLQLSTESAEIPATESSEEAGETRFFLQFDSDPFAVVFSRQGDRVQAEVLCLAEPLSDMRIALPDFSGRLNPSEASYREDYTRYYDLDGNGRPDFAVRRESVEQAPDETSGYSRRGPRFDGQQLTQRYVNLFMSGSGVSHRWRCPIATDIGGDHARATRRTHIRMNGEDGLTYGDVPLTRYAEIREEMNRQAFLEFLVGMGISFIPVVGSIIGVAEAAYGTDIFGNEMTDAQRVLGAASSLIPFAGQAMFRSGGRFSARAMSEIMGEAASWGKRAIDVEAMIVTLRGFDASQAEEMRRLVGRLDGETLSLADYATYQALLLELRRAALLAQGRQAAGLSQLDPSATSE